MSNRISPHLREFASSHTDVEAVVQRTGDATWDLIAVDPDGEWQRGVFLSKEAAIEAAGALGFGRIDSWEEGDLAKRANSSDAWSSPSGKRRAV